VTRRHAIAVAVALAAMLIALVPPLWVRATGDEVTLGIRPVDPLSLFRGNYVDLRYDAVLPGGLVRNEDDAVYAVFADTRPGRLLRVSDSRPDLAADEFCVRGRLAGDRVEFPHLEQFFVTAERGQDLERNLDDMVAVLRVTGGCRAVLVDLEPRVLP
jgi:uncharacterized membrane-anchored protein